MKRFTASTSLISSSIPPQISDSYNLHHVSANHQNPIPKDKNLLVAKRMNDKQYFRPPIQSASSGYCSLDDTESVSSRSSSPPCESELVEKQKVHDHKDTEYCSSGRNTSVAGYISSTGGNRSHQTLDKEYSSSNDLSRLQTFDSFCQNNGITDLRLPQMCLSCKPLVTDWEDTYNVCEATINSQTKIIVEKENELLIKECEARQTKLILEDARKKLYEVEENRDNLANCLLAINNILSVEGDADLRTKINGVFANVDILGELDNDVFEDEPKEDLKVNKPPLLNDEINAKHKFTLGSLDSNSSSDYLSIEDEQDHVAKYRSNLLPSHNRRHSLAPEVSRRPRCPTMGSIAQKARRNSMVIKTTIELGPDIETTKKESFIDSIDFAGKRLNSDRSIKRVSTKIEYPVNRRHSMQPVTNALSPKVNRRQSCYISGTQGLSHSSRDNNSLSPNIYDGLNRSSFTCEASDSSTSKSVNETRVGFPRKASSFMKEHSFQKNNFMVGKKCVPCGNRIKMGKAGFKCGSCSIICHLECMHNVPLSCYLDRMKDNISMSTKHKCKNYFQSPLLFETAE